MQEPTTTLEVIDALGGIEGAMELCGVKRGAVSMWKVNGLPANRYVQMKKLLHDRGYDAPPTLWGMKL